MHEADELLLGTGGLCELRQVQWPLSTNIRAIVVGVAKSQSRLKCTARPPPRWVVTGEWYLVRLEGRERMMIVCISMDSGRKPCRFSGSLSHLELLVVFLGLAVVYPGHAAAGSIGFRL
jgi:hypothetical protein